MNRLVGVFMLALALVTPVATQAQTAPTAMQDVYTVKTGDTLYELANTFRDDPETWRAVLAQNPFLNGPGRVFERGGMTIVVIRPGEELRGLQGLGILPTPVANTNVASAVTESTPSTASAAPWWRELWFINLACLLALAGLLYYMWRDARRRREVRRREELARDPITSGPPVVAGGIHPTEATRLDRHFEDHAVNDYLRNRRNLSAQEVRPNIRRIGPIETGMISGGGLVGYADRARRHEINPAQAGYRARFRFPDGSERELLSLQGCMNPCYYGEGLSGFQFEPRQEVVPVPETPAPAPQPVPHSALALRAIRKAADGEGASTITIGDRIMTVERGVHFDVNTETGEIKMNGASFEMSVKPKRARAVGKTTVTRTGTDQ